MVDFLIVGSGLYGSVFARNVAERGYSSIIVEKRNHIGGNCYSKKVDDIDVIIEEESYVDKIEQEEKEKLREIIIDLNKQINDV